MNQYRVPTPATTTMAATRAKAAIIPRIHLALRLASETAPSVQFFFAYGSIMDDRVNLREVVGVDVCSSHTRNVRAGYTALRLHFVRLFVGALAPPLRALEVVWKPGCSIPWYQVFHDLSASASVSSSRSFWPGHRWRTAGGFCESLWKGGSPVR